MGKTRLLGEVGLSISWRISKAWSTSLSIGIDRADPFLVCSRLISFLAKSICSQVREYCSDNLIPVPSEMVSSGKCSGNSFVMALRRLSSSSSVRKRMRPLFSWRSRTSCAGLPVTLPLRRASRKMRENNAW